MGQVGVVNRRMQRRLPPLPPLTPNALPQHSVFIKREKTCPLLLRVFTKVGSHHSKEDFTVRGNEPKNEFQIFTWKDATLRELTELLKEVTPEAKRGFARLSFAFVFPQKHGHFLVGNTFAYGNRKIDDDNALAELGFQIGDYLDVAIF